MPPKDNTDEIEYYKECSMMSRNIYLNTPDHKVELTDISLHCDVYGHYLSAKYRIEDNSSIRELNIPKIRLKINHGFVEIKHEDGSCFTPRINMGFGDLPLDHYRDQVGVYFTEKVLEEKVHEMTVDEIEKKLGYKVKIVSK